MYKKVIIVVAVLALGIGGFIFFGRGQTEEEEIMPTPTPTPAYQEVDENVNATLKANPSRTKVTLTITGMDGKYSGIEYEVTYMTDGGPKGTLSGSKPIPLKRGQDTFKRDVELGTCSTGGKCSYHKGVKDFRVFIKFHAKEGNVFVLKKEFEKV